MTARGYTLGSHWLVWLRADPRWDRLRSDPRLDALVRRMKYPA